MLGNSINIKNFNWNPVVLKNFAKTSKNYHFRLNLCKNGVPRGHVQNKKLFFFSELTKPDHTVKWGNTEQFSIFFLNTIDYLNHMAPILQT